jgi:hypothetical protein
MTQSIELNSAFVPEELLPSSQTTPEPIQAHVSSLTTLVGSAANEGVITSSTESFLNMFANRHDVGYGTDVSLLETDEAQRVLAAAMEELDTGVDSRDIADYLGRHRNNYMVTRIIGHTVLGLAENTLAYQAAGMSFDRAFGLASTMAAHHPGYPITMVSGLLPSEARLSEPQRAAFLVDNHGSNAEDMRGKIIAMAARHLHVTEAAAGKAAIIGFAYDRITPGTVPAEIDIQPDGSTVVRGGELLQKKFGLVTGDLKQAGVLREMSIAQIYSKTTEALRTEAQAATDAAVYANQGDIVPFIQLRAASVVDRVEQTQQGAWSALESLGFDGPLSGMRGARDHLLAAARSQEDPAFRYALASYDTVMNILNK